MRLHLKRAMMTIATTTTPTTAPVLDPTYTIKLLIELSSSTAAQRNEICLCYRGRGGYQCSHKFIQHTILTCSPDTHRCSPRPRPTLPADQEGGTLQQPEALVAPEGGVVSYRIAANRAVSVGWYLQKRASHN